MRRAKAQEILGMIQKHYMKLRNKKKSAFITSTWQTRFALSARAGWPSRCGWKASKEARVTARREKETIQDKIWLFPHGKKENRSSGMMRAEVAGNLKHLSLEPCSNSKKQRGINGPMWVSDGQLSIMLLMLLTPETGRENRNSHWTWWVKTTVWLCPFCDLRDIAEHTKLIALLFQSSRISMEWEQRPRKVSRLHQNSPDLADGYLW